MNDNSYMNAGQLVEFIKVGMLAGELDKIAADTKKAAKTAQVKGWAQRIKSAATNLSKVIDERLRCLEPKQLDSVERRFNNSMLTIDARDKKRFDGEEELTVTLKSDDFVMLAEMGLMGCGGCPQGKYVKDCQYRALFHRIGIPIARENVQDGQCEFMTRDVPKVCMPNGFTDAEARKKFTDEDRELLL